MKILSRSITSLILISLFILITDSYGLAITAKPDIPKADIIKARPAIKATVDINERQIRNSAEMVSESLQRATDNLEKAGVPQNIRIETLAEIKQAKVQLRELEDKGTEAVQQREEAVKKKDELITWLYGTGAVSIIAIIGHILKFPILERRYKKLLIAEKEATLIKEGIMKPKGQ